MLTQKLLYLVVVLSKLVQLSRITARGSLPVAQQFLDIFLKKLAIFSPSQSHFLSFQSCLKEHAKIQKPSKELNFSAPLVPVLDLQVKSQTPLNAWTYRFNSLNDATKSA